jgi:hypothetical protein
MYEACPNPRSWAPFAMRPRSDHCQSPFASDHRPLSVGPCKVAPPRSGATCLPDGYDTPYWPKGAPPFWWPTPEDRHRTRDDSSSANPAGRANNRPGQRIRSAHPGTVASTHHRAHEHRDLTQLAGCAPGELHPGARRRTVGQVRHALRAAPVECCLCSSVSRLAHADEDAHPVAVLALPT